MLGLLSNDKNNGLGGPDVAAEESLASVTNMFISHKNHKDNFDLDLLIVRFRSIDCGNFPIFYNFKVKKIPQFNNISDFVANSN